MGADVWNDESQWGIHLRRDEWPQRAGYRFIIAAFDDVLETLWKLSTEDVILEFRECGGYRVGAAGFFSDALMTGAFVAQAQPSTGGELRPILPTDWVPETVNRAIATGRIEQRLNGRRSDMWVFIDVEELGLLREVLSITDMLHQPDERGPLEEMGEKIIGSMNAIARARRPHDPKEAADRVLKLLLTSMKPSYDYADKQSLVAAASAWLRKLFDADPGRRFDRDHYEREVGAAFSPYISGRTFDLVWRDATGWKDAKGAQPHKTRRQPGPKTQT